MLRSRISSSKIKKKEGELAIPLKRTQDILAALGEQKAPGQVLCGFAMETENLLENATAKLTKKNCDMICANSLCTEGAGFGVDTNVLTLITEKGAEPLEKMTKEQAAFEILSRLKEF